MKKRVKYLIWPCGQFFCAEIDRVDRTCLPQKIEPCDVDRLFLKQCPCSNIVPLAFTHFLSFLVEYMTLEEECLIGRLICHLKDYILYEQGVCPSSSLINSFGKEGNWNVILVLFISE